MALSEQEQQMLDEIERALIAEDPRLAKKSQAGEASSFSFNIQSIALMFLGLSAMVGGISLAQFSLWFVALSVLGFFIMFAGGMLGFQNTGPATLGKGAKGSGRVKNAAGRAGAASVQKQRKQGGLGDRMEDNFRRRFER